ncbi:hypothetical protein CONPUDRAFT_80877 [Coniophora puteana RWD-64-598 SS2]|uniref:SCP domain-containing protein n=1 Tax=Coniophora puteana (strain RWD-64-598) TaxID=741705 RepID=A0A5M3MVG7_CONPW|nr:uncharacterized protein CONPUDRAFT_80877 [Coniophora puteana RWD-64-598 SS2]EIW82581.1 hypothetical protein CONPUDRAFT_80877 [Coniophora puteana RWD-64-598 SS2]
MEDVSRGLEDRLSLPGRLGESAGTTNIGMFNFVSFVAFSTILISVSPALAGSKTCKTAPIMSRGIAEQTYPAVHNAERAKYDAQPLAWNATPASAAQPWAEKCTFEHGRKYQSLR